MNRTKLQSWTKVLEHLGCWRFCGHTKSEYNLTWLTPSPPHICGRVYRVRRGHNNAGSRAFSNISCKYRFVALHKCLKAFCLWLLVRIKQFSVLLWSHHWHHSYRSQQIKKQQHAKLSYQSGISDTPIITIYREKRDTHKVLKQKENYATSLLTTHSYSMGIFEVLF